MKKLSINEIIPYLLLFLYTIVMAFLMVYWGNWTIGDDSIFLRTTALGKFNWCSGGWLPEAGRFFPLAHFDYNLTLLLPFLPSVKAHYLLNAISFCLYVFCLWWLVRQAIYSIDVDFSDSSLKSVEKEYLLFFFVLIALVFSKKLLLLALVLYALLKFCNRWITDASYHPWIVVAAVFVVLLQPLWNADFFELHTASRLYVVLTVLFMYGVYNLLEKQTWGYALLVLLTAAYLIYSYEYHFGVFAVFAVMMLLFYPTKTKLLKGVWYGVLGVSMSYLIVYLCCIYPHIQTAYSHGEKVFSDEIRNLSYWVRLYGVAVPLAVYRLYAVLVRKDRKHIFYDACLAAGLAGMCALIVLGIYDPYSHMTNIVLCSVPVMSLSKQMFGTKCALIVCFLLILDLNLTGPFIKTLNRRVKEMKETMPKVELIQQILDSGSKIVMIMPSQPQKQEGECTREEWCLMFERRLEAILTYEDEKHLVPSIYRTCNLEDASLLGRNNILWLAHPQWIEDATIADSLNRCKKRIEFGENVLYY